LLASLALAASASAANSNGADIVDEPVCETFENFATVCIEPNYVLHERRTPSGNYIWVKNGEVRYTVTFGPNPDPNAPPAGCTDSGYYTQHGQVLWKDGEQHEVSDRFKSVNTVNCDVGTGGITYTCEVFEHLHYANGEWIFGRVDAPPCIPTT
jgi:hypothetical protein